MTIYEALEELSSIWDMLSSIGVLTDEELEKISEVESTIIKFVKEHT